MEENPTREDLNIGVFLLREEFSANIYIQRKRIHFHLTTSHNQRDTKHKSCGENSNDRRRGGTALRSVQHQNSSNPQKSSAVSVTAWNFTGEKEVPGNECAKILSQPSVHKGKNVVIKRRRENQARFSGDSARGIRDENYAENALSSSRGTTSRLLAKREWESTATLAVIF